ncbi:MAG: NAD-dependent epimerase/dehydratase family protein [Polyangiaceae bacterium]|jgi:nucleoside-diphosphate-sugar epimerase
MHVFIAGGAGYIGSVLVPLLLEQGHRVTVLDRLYFGDTLGLAERRFGEKLRVARGDVRGFDRSLLHSVDAVIDLSGISNDPSCELEPDLTRSVNVDGAKRLAAAAREQGVRRYVYSTSCSVYGHGEGPGLTETSVRHPVSLYARAKAEVEDFLLGMGRSSGGAMDVTCLRLATVFGLSSRMRFDLAINVMTKNAYVNRRITVDGGGRQWRPFVHVRDVARAFELAMTSDARVVAGEVFNVGSDENNVQILNLAFRVRDAVPGTEVVHAPTDPDLRDYNVSFDKIRRVLSFRAERTVDDGIREVLGALREGVVDPDERRWYTLKQYVFLRDAERAHRELAIDGKLLAPAS